jgi:DEAD/DEAH box helicase domain-containing protein
LGSIFPKLVGFSLDSDESQASQTPLFSTRASRSIPDPEYLVALLSPLEVVSCTSQDAIDLWKSSNKNLVGEITVSSVLMVWSATDRQRHQKFDPTGSFVLLRLDDAPQGDKVMLRSSWVETLRLFNLYQFLPHSYAVTTMGMDREVKPLLPKLFATQPPEQKTAKDEQWQQIQELMVDERLLPAIEQMCQEGWWLPEAGYELLSDRNTVIAMAELAWVSHKIAVTLTEDDQDAFSTAGWSAWAIDDFLQSMDTIGNKLKGDA